MLELAAHGAKVLHAGCVEIAERSDIAIYACATGQHKGGTRIDRIGGGPRTRPVGITGQNALVRLRAPTTKLLVECASQSSLAVLHLSSQEGRSELWFSLDDVPDWAEVRKALANYESVTASEGYGAVSVVGDAIGSDAARIGAILTIAESQGITIEGLDSSQLRVTVFCARDDVDGLVATLHEALIEQERP
jgi:aspartokinase